MAQLANVMQETWVPSLGQENSLEKGIATHSSILAWRIMWTEEPGGLQSMGTQRVESDWVTNSFSLLHLSKWLSSKSLQIRTSLVVQWIRACLPMQGTLVESLVQEDSTCRGATKPMCHIYWAPMLQLLKPMHLEPPLYKRSHGNEKPMYCDEE